MTETKGRAIFKKGRWMDGRCWLLHNVLKSLYAEDPAKWHTQEELVGLCNESVGEAYSISNSSRSHNRCIGLWIDAQAINACPVPDHIVVIRETMMKMATPEEAAEMASDLHSRALAMLKRESDINSKIRRDGQGKVPGIDGKSAQPFHDAFGTDNPGPKASI